MGFAVRLALVIPAMAVCHSQAQQAPVAAQPLQGQATIVCQGKASSTGTAAIAFGTVFLTAHISDMRNLELVLQEPGARRQEPAASTELPNMDGTSG